MNTNGLESVRVWVRSRVWCIRCLGPETLSRHVLVGNGADRVRSRMGRGRLRPRVLSETRPFSGTSRPRPYSLMFLNASSRRRPLAAEAVGCHLIVLIGADSRMD